MLTHRKCQCRIHRNDPNESDGYHSLAIFVPSILLFPNICAPMCANTQVVNDDVQEYNFIVPPYQQFSVLQMFALSATLFHTLKQRHTRH